MRLKISAREIAALALNAALYAVGSYSTAYIPTPWLVQLRPAVVIPAVFAVLFGPLVGGLGAAIGTFIASIFTYGTATLTIFSGTPANFACFYLLGKLSRPYSREKFIFGTTVGFLAGSIIIGFGLLVLARFFLFLVPVALTGKLVNLATGLGCLSAIVWTLGTGLLCTLLIGLPVLRVCEKAFPRLLT
jgi:uncharacterized membrane protein